MVMGGNKAKKRPVVCLGRTPRPHINTWLQMVPLTRGGIQNSYITPDEGSPKQ